MKSKGIIRSLIRERQPFAVLAILAALLPYLLAGTGLYGSPGGIRLADGTLVICTSDGFKRVGDRTGSTGHDVNDCCKFGCVHAVTKVALGPAETPEPVRAARATEIAWARIAAGARHDAAATAPSIRAPPAASV